MKLNTDIQVIFALLVGVVYFLLLDYTIILGLVVFPFFIYFLLKIKSASMIRLWIVAIVLMFIASMFFSAISFFMLMIAFFVALFLDRTLRGGYTQENAIVYTAFLIGLSIILLLVMGQSLDVFPSINVIASQVIDWYGGQVKEAEKIIGSVIDMKMVAQSINQFFITLPAQILVFGFFLSLYTVLMVRVMNPTGKVWPKRPFMYWSVPRFVAHLYFIGLIITLFMGNEPSASFNVISNVMLILEWTLYVHGVAFAYYFFKKKKLNTAVTVILMIFVVILRPIMTFIGFMELIFRIRLRMELNEGRK